MCFALDAPKRSGENYSTDASWTFFLRATNCPPLAQKLLVPAWLPTYGAVQGKTCRGQCEKADRAFAKRA